MPVMDGIDATKEIRRLEKLNAAEGYPPASPFSLPSSSLSAASAYTATGASPYRSSVIIVAQTASSLNSDRVKALAAGCNDFLTKPVNHHWLNNKVTEWGSIKALQMWADMPPPGGQQNGGPAAHAREVAERLHVPERSLSRSRRTPPKIEANPEAEGGAGKGKEVVASGTEVSASSGRDTTNHADSPSPKEGQSGYFRGESRVLILFLQTQPSPMEPRRTLRRMFRVCAVTHSFSCFLIYFVSADVAPPPDIPPTR